MVSTSARARLIVFNLSIRFRLVFDGAGNDDSVPNTNNDGTSPFGPIVWFISFMEIRSSEF